MPKDTAQKQDEDVYLQNQSDLRDWLSFAKTQAITTELLKFELDALADALEFKSKSIIEAFEELVALMQEHPEFNDNADMSRSLSNMVRSLQFQDIAKQKLENISNALTSIRNYADSKITATNATHKIDDTEIALNTENLDQVISERTLAEMRKSMTKNLESLSKSDFDRLSETTHDTQSEDDNSSNVELF